MAFHTNSRAFASMRMRHWREARARRRALADILAKNGTRLLDDAGLTREDAMMMLDGADPRRG